MAAVTVRKSVHPQNTKYVKAVILVLCIIGLCISTFGLYIEILKEKNPNYVPFCDINTYIACSRALTSRYGKGFGILDKFVSNTSVLNQPNTVYGIAFYTFQATLTLSSSSSAAVVQTVASVLANIGSIYLAICGLLIDFPRRSIADIPRGTGVGDRHPTRKRQHIILWIGMGISVTTIACEL